MLDNSNNILHLRFIRADKRTYGERPMLMKVRTTEFDGTPDEFLKVAHHFGNQAPTISESSRLAEAPNARPPSEEREPEITAELVERVLTRRHLSRSMKGVLKAL